MTAPLHIVLLAEGDPDSPIGSGSGTPASLASGLRSLGHRVTTADVDIRGATRAAVAAATWSPNKRRWVAQYHLAQVAFAARSRNAVRATARAGKVDAVLQYGATFSTVDAGIPVFLFCDSNTLFSATEPASWGSALSAAGLRGAVALERALYGRSAAIFTMSQYIARSFIEDFLVPPDRVLAVGAGPNIDPMSLAGIARDPQANGGAPTILFIGREFERKGGDVLLEAFGIVRRTHPEARLIIVGPRDRVAVPEGAEWLGFLDRTAPADWAVLRNAFERATVFTLPSRHEPFGLVVLEAMYAGLPVVATRIGALAEMVDDTRTGLLVAPGDAGDLASAVLRVSQGHQAFTMGLAGRERAQRTYSWQRVTEAIGSVIREHVSPNPHSGLQR
jgi:glycosyltransferase involved in cell wall biosynthesis